MTMMNYRQLLKVLALLVVLATMWTAARAQAQAPCPYADIRLETELPVDADAICNAAQPWADDGFRIFVFLTDYRPTSEDDWFALLDQAEADAGIRGPDGFDKNALAFEASSTATSLGWAYSVTYGEQLYNTALDTDDMAILQIKQGMRTAIAAGDPTGALVQALSTSYEINHPPPSPWLWVGIGILLVAALGAGGYVLTPRVISPAIQRARRRTRLKRYLKILQTRTSNLLTTCDQLLKGDTPEETVLYQLFSAYGGENYEDIHADVHEWLRRSQEALNDAFDLRQKLLAPEVQEKRALEQLVQDWEMLYVTFVGNSERILTLTDDELHTLLDPMLVLDREAADVQLAEQLDGIRRELAGMPLKVELMMIDPAKTDAEGMLGYVDQVKAQLARLQEAQREAPGHLAEAQAQRQAAEEDLPSPFVLTGKQLFAGIDQRLAEADAALKQELFLRVMEQAAEVLRDIETVRAFLTAMGEHDRRQTKIEAITSQGYRPAHLADDLKEVEADIQAITKEITASDYVEAATWIEELNADSQWALAWAQEWQALQDQNATTLRHLRDEMTRVEQYQVNEAAPAWEALQAYPKGNWADVADDMAQATQTLQSLREDQVGQIERFNSMEEQKFNEAEQMLAQAAADLAQAEQQLQAVVNRLPEVKAAEASIQEALRLTEADLAKAEAFRDQEDVKIEPEVDKQIEKAGRQLAQGQQLMKARNFIAATEAQSKARQLATAAYASASKQVKEVNDLQAELEKTAKSVSGKVGKCKTKAKALPAAAQTAKTNKLVQQVTDGFSKAQQAHAASTGLEDRALAKALRAAIAAYDKVSQRADQALQQIAADHNQYENYRTAALGAVRAAQAAIQKAEQSVRNPDAGSAGHHALQRARTLLPTVLSDNVSKQALNRLQKQAEEAKTYAEQAERQAGQKIRTAQAKRDRQRQQDQRRQWQHTLASPKRPSATVPAKRPSSRATSRRPSSRGESRRPSSRGGSRRPSSRGTSRRR
jgi:hypothetical protein